MQIKMSSTPPALANIGLHRVTQIRNRRFKASKRLVASSTDDELFVWRPQFRKIELTNDQDMEEKSNESSVADDLEGTNFTAIAQRLMNFLKGNLSHRWIWREFGDCFVDAPILEGVYDMASLMDEYLPQLKTRYLPRRGWQLLRRSVGKARRFSPAFIEIELKEPGSSDHSAGEQEQQEQSVDPPFLEHATYSTKLLESIVRVKELMAIKKRALYEIALKNEEILDNKEPKSRGSYDHIYTKIMYQRCFAAMYSVNNDIVAPMTVLHEYLVQYRKETDERKARERSALEIYARCCRKAELDLQRNESLELGTPSTRELVLSLQTVLYVTGELGGPNSNELLVIVDNLFSHLLETLPPELSFQLKQTMDELEPYRKRMNNLFKIVPKEEASKDMQ